MTTFKNFFLKESSISFNEFKIDIINFGEYFYKLYDYINFHLDKY